MKHIQLQLELKYQLPENTLFYDIETTGLSREKNHVYLIGCGHYQNGVFYLHQFLSENRLEEAEILKAFMDIACKFDAVITFNGIKFDQPFLIERCHIHNILECLSMQKHQDIYQMICPFKNVLRLENMKQKSLEYFLGIHRDDQCSGGELIEVYKKYEKCPTEDSLHLMLLHNKEDVLGMLDLHALLAYPRLFDGEFTVCKAFLNQGRDYDGNNVCELMLSLQPDMVLPGIVAYEKEGIYISGKGNRLNIKIPVMAGQIKRYYTNYKDYYYLPLEDTAIHKSIADYVDKEYRIKATKATCYTKLQITDSFLEDFEQLKIYVITLLSWLQRT